MIAIHLALLAAFLHLSGKIDLGRESDALKIFEIPDRPPPRSPVSPPHPHKPAAKRRTPAAQDKASAPVDRIAPALQTTAPVAANPPQMPERPVAASKGASTLPGSGAGASGTDAGNGGGGNGAGNGGDGGVGTPPRLETRVLGGGDFPAAISRQWPRGSTIFLRLRIDIHGYIAECLLDRGSGVASIDGAICNLAHDRLRFRPALNHGGEAVAGWVGYAQPAPH